MSAKKSAADAHAGRFAYEGLDRVLHEKARLAIMTSLMRHPAGVLFNDLKKLCALTDGNLNRHLEVLHREKLVEVWKNQESRRPQTLFRVTTLGKKAFLEYLQELERLVHDALPGKRSQPSTAPLRGWTLGWD
jgi:DNA-binding MarR family transcriptional regulator